jgi:PEGA domain/IPT/TIG domain
MKRLIVLVFLAALLLLLPAGVSASGWVNISSTPSGASGYLNDAFAGLTPVNQSTPAGNYTVMLRASGFSDYTTTITVADNSVVMINHVFQNSAPAISGISPASGVNTSTLSDVTISGSGFSTSTGKVVLTKSGETNITGTCDWGSASTLTCSFPLKGKTAGTWNVVVVNADGQSVSLANGFTVKRKSGTPTLSAINPSSGATNTTVSITSLEGTNFASDASILLRRSSYDDITGSVSSVNSAGTVIAASFNLNNQAPGNYDVCVYNDEKTYTCDLTFKITNPNAGTSSSVFFDTNPTGAAIYLNKTRVGTSVFTYYNATPGTYDVLIQKDGYKDYSGSLTVVEGRRTTFSASLTKAGEDTSGASVATPARTATTIRKSTIKVPTTWADIPPASTTSPVDPVIPLGAAALGVGLVVLRRR